MPLLPPEFIRLYLLMQLGGGLRRGVPGLEQLHQAMDLRPPGRRHPKYPSVCALQRSVQHGLDVAHALVAGLPGNRHAALLGRHGRRRGRPPRHQQAVQLPESLRSRQSAMREWCPARRRRRGVLARRRGQQNAGCHGLESVLAVAGRPQLHALPRARARSLSRASGGAANTWWGGRVGAGRPLAARLTTSTRITLRAVK
jgi:hypothetical protein